MDQNRSNIAWLMAESKTLALCGKQAWSMVPKWQRGSLGVASSLMAANSLANICQAFIIGAIVDLLKNAAKIGIFAEFDPKLQPAVNAAAKAAAIANNAVAQNQLMWQAGKLLGIIGLLYLMRETFNVVRRYLVENTCTGLNREMQMRVAGHVMRYDMQQLNTQKLGSMHGRIIRSVDGLIQFIRLMFLDFLPAILTGVFALVAVVIAQPIMGAVMLGVVPISVFLTLQQLKSQKGVRLDLMRDAEEVDGMLVEQMAGVEYIRVANTLDREAERLSVTTDRRRKRELKHHFEMSLFGSGKAINEGLFNLLVLAVATYLVIDGRMEVGGIYVFMNLFLSVMTPLSEIHRIIDIGHESSLKMADLRELLDRPIDESFDTPPVGNMVGIAAREPEIEVVEASAIYASGDRVKQVLYDVSFKVHQGEVIGIAGQSGGGKSSMIKLLLRLLHPTHGTVKVHGVPIDLMDRATLADLVGYVGQNPFVFSGTIRENIVYGCGDVSDEQVQYAASAAHIHDEILGMHDGYNTPVSERGSNLSGGQRQRLAIARLLLRNTPILILDEATSALDNISERSIQGSLGIRSGKQTIMMIAHRLTTLRHCDKILVFDEGRIVESGTFENLSRANGKFAELLRASESEIEAIAS